MSRCTCPSVPANTMKMAIANRATVSRNEASPSNICRIACFAGAQEESSMEKSCGAAGSGSVMCRDRGLYVRLLIIRRLPQRGKIGRIGRRF